MPSTTWNAIKLVDLLQAALHALCFKYGKRSKYGWGNGTYSYEREIIARREFQWRLESATNAVASMEEILPASEHEAEQRAKLKVHFKKLVDYWYSIKDSVEFLEKLPTNIEREADYLDQSARWTVMFWYQLIHAIEEVQKDGREGIYNMALDKYDEAAKAAWAVPGAKNRTDPFDLSNAHTWCYIYTMALRSIGNPSVLRDAKNSLSKLAEE